MHARIAATATAVPSYILRQEEIVSHARDIFAPAVPEFDRFAPIYANAAIATRHSCVPLDWYGRPHVFAERNDLYLRHAVDLLETVARELLHACDLAAAEVDGLVVASTTGVATPSLDALLMERIAFRRDLQRMPLFGLGCAGGVTGLARSAQLAEARPGSRYLFLVVELCGLTFRVNDTSKSNIVATALFGDGAAGALVTTTGDGPALTAAYEHTWPASLDVMGWRVGDDGLGVLFSRDIPQLIRSDLAAPLQRFLAAQGTTLAEIDGFICHPGGAKVLDALEEVFGLAAGGLAAARAVLRRYGNMSAATVLFVLDAAMRQGLDGRQLMSAMGPGFTASFALLDG
jgi:alkylresorcinol/alkylpyrone synthase